MKSYSFAPISAREYPTVRILDHPYIWGGVQFALNVSERAYSPELEAAMAAHGIEWAFCPVSEEEGADWRESLERGLRAMLSAYNCKIGHLPPLEAWIEQGWFLRCHP